MESITQLINYPIKKMQLSDRSSQSAIINIAINIFQNVGIRRWIQEIQILKNQQIYFQICKIIFPETIIHLFRLSENHSLKTGQKIQGVIDIIAKIINNDLYHISGEAIANGKTIHLKNFLQLLEALSNSMIAKDMVSEVMSAPEKDQSFTYNDLNKSYYTVMGTFKEFGPRIIYTDVSSETRQESQGTNIEGRQEIVGRESVTTITSSGAEPPMSPKGESGRPGVRHPVVRSKEPKNTPPFASVQASRQLPYPQPLRQKNDQKFDQQNHKWLALVKGMDETKINLWKERMMEMKESYLQWKGEHDYETKRIKKNIEKESSNRKKHINSKINEREYLINSLKGEQQAVRAMKDLFRQQKKAKMQQSKQMLRRNQKKLEELADCEQLNELLQQAASSTRMPHYRKE